MTKLDLEAIVKTKLAPLPGNVLRILNLLRDVNCSTKSLSTAVGYDTSLTTRILRLANSPYYSLQKNVTTLHQAVETVGTRSIYDIVILKATGDSFAKEIRNSVFGRLIWEHCLVVAFLARELSLVLGMRGSEDIFICGLLHDIGKIMLLRANVELYTNLLEKKEENEMLLEEQVLFGYNHTQIGGLVVQRWGLPDEVSHAILNHHNATNASHSVLAAHIIVVADTIANINGYGLRLEDESALLFSESVMILNLSQQQLEKAWDDVQESLNEVIETFN